MIRIRQDQSGTILFLLTTMKTGAMTIQQQNQYQLILKPTMSSIKLYIFLAPKIQLIAMVWKNVHHRSDIPEAA